MVKGGIKIFGILTVLLLGACASFNDPHVKSGAVGGLGGLAIGAGTGATVGAVIANGDVLGSALLGGAIGLPVGVLIGVAARSYYEETQLEENNKIIARNMHYIKTREAELLSLREEVLSDFQTIEIDSEYRQYYYTAPSLGGYQ